jgi:hypothetical protein
MAGNKKGRTRLFSRKAVRPAGSSFKVIVSSHPETSWQGPLILANTR